MYVVSEVTGKKYPTVEACIADERKVEAERKAQERAKADAENMKRLDDAWDKLIESMEHFVNVADEINPEIVEDVKPLIRIMKLA